MGTDILRPTKRQKDGLQEVGEATSGDETVRAREKEGQGRSDHENAPLHTPTKKPKDALQGGGTKPAVTLNYLLSKP